MFDFTKGAVNEDRLTGAVFGLMNYLAHPEFLHPFLGLLSGRNNEFKWSTGRPPSDCLLEPWPSFDIPVNWRPHFPPTSSGGLKATVVPDAVLTVRWKRWGVEQRPRLDRIWVEAEHSKAVEADQLAQQWAVMTHHCPADETWWLLLLNSTPSLPWPEGSRPETWPGEGRLLAPRDLKAWCTNRVHHLRAGATVAPTGPSASSATPRLLHLSWQNCAALLRELEIRSWAYRQLFRGARDYLARGQYHPPTRFLDVTELGSATPIVDRASEFRLRLPPLLATDPLQIPEPP